MTWLNNSKIKDWFGDTDLLGYFVFKHWNIFVARVQRRIDRPPLK
jgi:hypothetical protein